MTSTRDPSDTTLLKAYEMTCKDLHDSLKAHQGRAAFFVGTLLSVFTASAAALLQPTIRYQLMGVVGSVVIISLAWLGYRATDRFYQRFLEAVTVKAKLEYRLGLMQEHNAADADWWGREPLVPARHIVSRGRAASSGLFVAQNMRYGYQASVVWLFRICGAIGVVLLLAGGFQLWRTYSTVSPQDALAQFSSKERCAIAADRMDKRFKDRVREVFYSRRRNSCVCEVVANDQENSFYQLFDCLSREPIARTVLTTGSPDLSSQLEEWQRTKNAVK